MLEELTQLLPGSYDNQAQARSAPDHLAIRLVIAPVQAPLVGDHVFYVQEMAADDERRVLAQRLYLVEPVVGSEKAMLSQLDFAEPLRWRDGHLNRDLFRSLLMQDLRLKSGCELLWEREDGRFVAGTGQGCRASSRTTGETLRVEQRMRLGPEDLEVFEQQRDAAGQVVYGAEPDPWYRFSRRADKPW